MPPYSKLLLEITLMHNRALISEEKIFHAFCHKMTYKLKFMKRRSSLVLYRNRTQFKDGL